MGTYNRAINHHRWGFQHCFQQVYKPRFTQEGAGNISWLSAWNWSKTLLPSGNLLEFANLKTAIEIVDLPIKTVIFHSDVSLPKGTGI
jgi:hypothetical protein